MADVADRKVFNAEAYQNGVYAGWYDRINGSRSDYAWHGGQDAIYSYAWHYSRGYRDGWDRRTAPTARAEVVTAARWTCRGCSATGGPFRTTAEAMRDADEHELDNVLDPEHITEVRG